MSRFFAPIASVDRRALASVLGGLFLLTLYLYQGHHSFFTRRLGQLAASGLDAEWLALGYQFLAALLLLLLAPLLWLLVDPRLRLADHGLRLGDWRFGLKVLVLGAAALALPLYLGAGAPELRAEYPLAKIAGRSALLFLLWELSYLGYYIAWEFFFRGFWQLGLERSLGAFGALALQTATSTVMHIGKPESETMAAIVGGAAFGLIALRTRSVIYVILLHWAVGIMTDAFCLLRGS